MHSRAGVHGARVHGAGVHGAGVHVARVHGAGVHVVGVHGAGVHEDNVHGAISTRAGVHGGIFSHAAYMYTYEDTGRHLAVDDKYNTHFMCKSRLYAYKENIFIIDYLFNIYYLYTYTTYGRQEQ